MQSIDEILDEIFYQSEMHHWEALVRIAFVQEREAREKAEAERDEYLGCWKRTDEHCDRIERETIERCIALIAGMFTRAPEVVAEIEARIRAMGDKP